MPKEDPFVAVVLKVADNILGRDLKGYNELFVCFVERSGGSRKGNLALEDAGWVRRLFNSVDIKPLYSTAS